MALGKGKQRMSVVLTKHQVTWVRAFAQEADLSASQVMRAALNVFERKVAFTVPEADDDPFTKHSKEIVAHEVEEICNHER